MSSRKKYHLSCSEIGAVAAVGVGREKRRAGSEAMRPWSRVVVVAAGVVSSELLGELVVVPDMTMSSSRVVVVGASCVVLMHVEVEVESCRLRRLDPPQSGLARCFPKVQSWILHGPLIANVIPRTPMNSPRG